MSDRPDSPPQASSPHRGKRDKRPPPPQSAKRAARRSSTDDDIAATLSPATAVAISRLQGRIPEALVSEAVGGFLRALLSGLEESRLLDSCSFEEADAGTLTIKLRGPAKGTVATRSRVPAEWVLLRTVRVSIDEEETTTTTTGDPGKKSGSLSGSSKLRLSGLQVVPIEGALDCWRALSARFAARGATTLDDRRSVAWEWWTEEGDGDGGGGRSAFEGTKLWRVVESLSGLGYGRVVPTYAKASLVLGCSLGLWQDVTSLHFRCDEAVLEAKDGVKVEASRVVDVVGTLKPVPETYDPSSPHYNRDEDIKDDIGRSLWEETTSSQAKRQIAAKFATSSLNYAALFCAREGEKGSTAFSLQKLFTVGRCVGGARKIDCLKGRASSWQLEDDTYQMTGGDGRIVWEAMPEEQN